MTEVVSEVSFYVNNPVFSKKGKSMQVSTTKEFLCDHKKEKSSRVRGVM